MTIELASIIADIEVQAHVEFVKQPLGTIVRAIKVSIAVVTLLAVTNGKVRGNAQPISSGGGFAAHGISSCQTDLRKLNQLSGWQVRWPQEWANLSTASDDDIKAALLRWEGAPSALHADIKALKDPKAAKAPQAVVTRVLAQVDELSRDLAREVPTIRSMLIRSFGEAGLSSSTRGSVPRSRTIVHF